MSALLAVSHLYASVLAAESEWAYVGGAYGVVIGVLVAYIAWTIIRGRRVGRRLPPEDRRWM